MKNTLRVVLLVFISFGIYFLLDTLYFKALRTLLYEWSNQIGISHIATYAISGIPLFLGTLFISRKTSVFKSLDLDKSAIRGFVFALICTLPMFIGFAFVFNFESDISINTILISVVAAGFFEELFFRGFLFGQLFKNTKLGFIPAVFFGAVYFGLLHLYQSTDLGELTGIFLVTFLGGILFAWVYVEWNYNIWLPIFLHLLMNLTWELFAVSHNALGGVYANVFRLLTIAFIIILTIVYKKQNGLKLEVNRRTVWMKGGIG
ncbi:CPBP family intramembrane metalloprotease [Aequorivita sp. F47161]|uniref:CPBP family intramembrane metalloprotease n=1 Tax=Aequorivita vitellina TaxID=2874475 RepID=A0A9X1QZ07_9FLAO|nr:type II CAAX endopeptidase family protein [Aequorivita vitellina]MCG2420481.1 CPBP family intramembrane metalloprotease [Aequorivita vitellina]